MLKKILSLLYLLISILVVLPFPNILFAQETAGLSVIQDFDQLPLIKDSIQAKQVSSYDKNGGNDDGNWDNPTGYLYKEGNNFIIFDDTGPGVVERFWVTGFDKLVDGFDPIRNQKSVDFITQSHLLFYFDGESSPRLDVKLADLFSGNTSPFISPLVGDRSVSSGGYYSYVPVYYRQRLKIAVTKQPYYYSITYQSLPQSTQVNSTTGQESYFPVQNILRRSGSDFKPSENYSFVRSSANIAPGATTSIAELNQPGVIQSIKLVPGELSEEALNNSWIKIWWDDMQSPSVNAPLGQFFGTSFGKKEVKSLPIGITPQGTFYSYFPMPYWKKARVVIENKSSANLPLNFEIGYQNRDFPTDAGYFSAFYNQEHLTSKTKNYTVLNTTGKGHFVGVSLSTISADNWHLEGDELVYVDGSKEPTLHGTGTEDYFNAGWYFERGPFNLPFHGAPVKDWGNSLGTPGNYKTSMYRFHITDYIPFTSAISFEIEYENSRNHDTIYKSVAYYYKFDPNKDANSTSNNATVELIINNFGKPGDRSVGDQNGDGIVNELDFGAIYSR